MKPIILQLPDSLTDRRAWLERQLVGLELGDLVSELVAVHQARSPHAAPAPTLQQDFAGELPRILQQGLSVLTEKQLGLLLKHPSLLTDLQDAVLERGGSYWDGVPRSDEFESRLVAQRDDLSQQLATGSASTASTKPESPAPRPLVSAVPTPGRWKTSTILAIVAGLAIGVTLWMSRPSGPAWGFHRSGILTANVSASEYLDSLAIAAGDWFNQRPEEPQAVATRLREFIHGCDTLIEAPHSQLSPDDRAWLVERCRTWKSALESQLADLEANRSSAAEVRDATDETILKMQNALHQRAIQAA